MKSLAVLGAGAIGCSVGADLTKTGHDVLLIDQWPAHIEAMKAHGLRIALPNEEFLVPVKAAHLCELNSLRKQFDIVFLASKSYDTCWLVEFIKPYLKPGGVLVSLQNSFNDEWIAPIIGYGRDIGCAVTLAAESNEPGRVKRITDQAHTSFTLGELHGRITPRLQEVAQILSVAGKAETTTNIWGTKWSKLVFNSMTPWDVLTGVSLRDVIDSPDMLKISVRLGRETVQVGVTLGYRLEPIFGLTAEDFLHSVDNVLEQIVKQFVAVSGGKGRSHAIQDISKGRRTELEYLNGLVVKKGREAHVSTPLNEAVTSLVKQIEQGKLTPNLSNLKILDQHT